MVVNVAEFLPGDFTRNPDFSLPTERLKRAIVAAAGREQDAFHRCLARSPARCSAIRSPPTCSCVGYAYQLGALPLSAEAIERAIELNGEAVEMNKPAFRWGRRAAADPTAVEALSSRARGGRATRAGFRISLDEMVERRVAFLTDYQNAAYAARYRDLRRARRRPRGGAGARARAASPKRSRAICSS